MGFNWKMFMEELKDMYDNGESLEDIFNYIEDQKKYAKECGQL